MGRFKTKTLFAQTVLAKYLEHDREKSGKTWQEKKSLISTFACFFWLLLRKFNFCKGDWALGYAIPQIWDFPNISLFPRTQVLSHSATRSVTRIHMVRLTIRYHLFLEFWLVDTWFFLLMTSPPCCDSPRKCTPIKYKNKQ